MSYGNSWEAGDKGLNRNPWPLIVFTACLAFVLALRLFSIQVLQYNRFLSQSVSIRIKPEIIEAPRGFIFDRNGDILAENQMSYAITVDPFERDKLNESIPRLYELVPELPDLLGATPDDMIEKVRKISRRSNNPEKIINKADFNLLSIVEEYSNELPGLGSTFDQARHYPYGPLAAHIIGYMGELTREEYDRLRYEGYGYGHSIGRLGIEKNYEHILKGSNGSKFVEMNYLSRRLGMTTEMKPVPPEAGRNITLTLDARLQIAAEAAFGDSVVGSIVALDPNTGEVLVMASLPAFDPNEFIGFMSPARLNELQTNPDHPLFNRAIQATYPPGSTFKMLTSIAGLENGFDESTTFHACRGVYYFGRPYKCWKEGGHGTLDMVGAITQSCNVYFYQLGRRISFERWYPYGEMLGFGKNTGIDIIGEKPGLLPNMEFYERQSEGYSPGKMLNLAIGQGEILVTMLQLAHYAGVIATEGIDAQPHLVMDEREPPKRIAGISRESFQVVKKGMRGVIHEPTGTARSLRFGDHVMAGKTGTAQNPHGPGHKLFVAFAPYDNPKIAIACVAENADKYPSSLAVAITKRLLMEYFELYPDIRIASND